MSSPIHSSWEDAVRWLRDQPGREKIVRDAYYDDPLQAAAERYWHSNEWEAVRGILVNISGDALDAGAGRGIASYALAKEGFHVTALEPDPSDLVGAGAIRALAAATQLPIEVIEDLTTELPFADKSFDVIFARAVLHHIDDLPQAMREFHRVLRPGGIFVAAREHVISDASDLAAFFEIHPLHSRYGGENAFTVSVYQDAVRQSGMILERTIGSLDSPINYGPQTTEDVHRRIIASFIPVAALRPVALAALNIPSIGTLIRRIASRFDRRPGRHASFIARKCA